MSFHRGDDPCGRGGGGGCYGGGGGGVVVRVVGTSFLGVVVSLVR